MVGEDITQLCLILNTHRQQRTTTSWAAQSAGGRRGGNLVAARPTAKPGACIAGFSLAAHHRPYIHLLRCQGLLPAPALCS